MRYLIISISFLALIATAKAQKLNFCEALPMLEKNTTEEFVDIRKEVDNTVKYPTTYFSSIQILEATSSRIVQKSDVYSFKADFGTFSTKDEALKKMNTLHATIKSCYPNFYTTFSTDMLKVSEYHSFCFTSEKSFRLYSAHFKLRTLSGKTDLSFEFDAEQKKSAFYTNPKKAFYDFGLIDSNLSYDDFSVALRKVVEEAKTGFKTIMGTETDYGRGFTCYRTKYFIPGYSSFIEDRTLGLVFYVVPTFQRATAQTFAASAEKAQKMIQAALGSNYGFRTTEDGRNQIYVHKFQPNKPVVELFIKEKEGEFIFELYVKSLE
jgi:hypothetical protein